MEINQNQTNISPAGVKPPGFSALQLVVDNKKEAAKVESKTLSKPESAENQLQANAPDAKKNELSLAVNVINEQVQNIQRDLVFSYDEESGRQIVVIKDAKSDKVIRQLPTEEALALARNLSEQLDENDSKGNVVNLFSSIA